MAEEWKYQNLSDNELKKELNKIFKNRKRSKKKFKELNKEMEYRVMRTSGNKHLDWYSNYLIKEIKQNNKPNKKFRR